MSHNRAFVSRTLFSTPPSDLKPVVLYFRPHVTIGQLREAHRIAGLAWDDQNILNNSIVAHSDTIADRLRALPYMCESVEQVVGESLMAGNNRTLFHVPASGDQPSTWDLKHIQKVDRTLRPATDPELIDIRQGGDSDDDTDSIIVTPKP